jgi:hypothetical protein
MATQTTAQKQFNEEIKIMKNQLTKLQKEVAGLEKLDVKGNWGFVGNAKEANRQLAETLKFVR